MKLFIPSRGRSSLKFLNGAYSPLRWLRGTKLVKQAFYCVREDEVEAYRTSLKDTGIGVLSMGKAKNLGEKRDRIVDWFVDEDKFMMCDDDVMLYIRKSPDVFNLRYPEPKEVEKVFKQIEALLDDYCMVGVSPREGNNRMGNGPFPLLAECARSMRMYAFRTKDYLSIKPNRLSEMADFDTVLQFLRSGRKNAVIYYWAQGQPDSQHAGGCSIYRTAETHDKICRQLQALHPDFVKLRQKVNKGDQAGFGTRTEVTVQWRKAYESSQKLKASLFD